MKVVVADTSPINYLVLIGEIGILPRLSTESSLRADLRETVEPTIGFCLLMARELRLSFTLNAFSHQMMLTSPSQEYHCQLIRSACIVAPVLCQGKVEMSPILAK